MIRYYLIALLFFALVAGKSAYAADDAVLQEIQALKARISELEKRLEEHDVVKQEHAEATKKKEQGRDLTASLTPRPTIKTKDGDISFSLDGRLMLDGGFVTRDRGVDLADATDVRRLWLGVKGAVGEDWGYRMQVALENDESSLKDAYISYNGFDNLGVKLGHYKEYTGIEDVASNLHTTFMERSVASTTLGTADRYIGLSLTPHGALWGGQIGLFGDSAGDNGADDEGYALSGRIHRAFMQGDDRYLHVGVSGRYRVPEASQDSVRFRARGESHVIGERLVDTGTITGVDSYTTMAAEARYQHGPVALMGEYFINHVERESAADPSFDGGYVSLAYMLTGEQRSYDASKGVYGRVTPAEPLSRSGGGLGAWELAARYSWMDLNDAGVTGGTLDAYTLAVNWYPTAWTRFMVNYVINDVDGNAVYPNADPQYLMMRAQVDF